MLSNEKRKSEKRKTVLIRLLSNGCVRLLSFAGSLLIGNPIKTGIEEMKNSFPSANDSWIDVCVFAGATTKAKTKKPKNFPCLTCNKFFVSNSAVQRHQVVHTRVKPYACDQCDERFTQTEALNAHLVTHTGEKPHKCPKCDFCFSYSAQLRRHEKSHNELLPYPCPKCTAGFRTQKGLSLHQRIHTQVETQYLCYVCNQSFTSDSRLKQHIKNHSNPKMCRLCGKLSPTPAAFKRHQVVHTGAKPYKCEVCHKSYTQKNSYKRHLHQHDKKGKIYDCPKCEKKFSDPYCVRRHMTTHLQEMLPYLCPSCPKRFRKATGLRHHEEIHTGVGNQYLCYVCNRIFTSESRLKQHLENHSMGKKYSCNVCDRRFFYKSKCLLHRATHKDRVTVKPHSAISNLPNQTQLENHYVCETCGRRFATIPYLRCHLKTHLGVKHTCDQCGKELANLPTLRRHKKALHTDRVTVKPHSAISNLPNQTQSNDLVFNSFNPHDDHSRISSDSDDSWFEKLLTLSDHTADNITDGIQSNTIATGTNTLNTQPTTSSIPNNDQYNLLNTDVPDLTDDLVDNIIEPVDLGIPNSPHVNTDNSQWRLPTSSSSVTDSNHMAGITSEFSQSQESQGSQPENCQNHQQPDPFNECLKWFNSKMGLPVDLGIPNSPPVNTDNSQWRLPTSSSSVTDSNHMARITSEFSQSQESQGSQPENCQNHQQPDPFNECLKWYDSQI